MARLDGPQQAGHQIERDIGADFPLPPIDRYPEADVGHLVVFAVAGEVHQQVVLFREAFGQYFQLVDNGVLSGFLIE